jgi:hypothetical protein
MSNAENTGDTGGGFIAGNVTPAARVPPIEQPLPQQQVSQPNFTQPPQYGGQQPILQGQGPAPRWTDEDLERARQQEKDKLYGRIDEVQLQLRQIQADREAEQAERQRLADEAAEARRLKEEGELEVRDLLARKETEWQQNFSKLEQRYDADRAVFEKERLFAPSRSTLRSRS